MKVTADASLSSLPSFPAQPGSPQQDSAGEVRSASLGKLRRTEARRETWANLRALWVVSTVPRQRTCAHHCHGDGVEIRKRGDQAHFSGLISCGLIWTCPRCGQKILLERAADIAAAITALYALGGCVTLVTPTWPHTRTDSLPDGFAHLNAFMTAARDDRSFKRARKGHRMGTITRREVTYGDANGWHVHAHRLDFFEPGTTAETLDAIEDAERRAYTAAVARAGRELHAEVGITFRRLNIDQAHEHVAGYVAKSAGLELADPGSKRGRRPGRRTPSEILTDAVTGGLARDWALWHEYEASTRGQFMLRWSNGLRGRLIPELGAELSDAQAAEAGDGLGRLLMIIPRDVWARVIKSRPGPAALLQWAEVYEDDDEARELVVRKLEAALRAAQPPPRPG